MMRSVVVTTFLMLGALVPALLAADLPRVPEGYSVEVVAEAPLVKHPMMACFDQRGRLFVAESAGTNRPAQELIDEPLDFIRMLEDTDGDGTFDKSTIFADKLTFPQGVLCHEGAVYTCAPPHVWKLEDTDDDGIADKRTVLVESFGFSGNAASIHGPFLGPDGRLYWCDGRHGHEFFDAEGEIVSTGKAARIFSCKTDGSDVRPFCGGGMDNPVEVDWLDSGEMIGTVNLFYGRPRGDVLVHWVEGGVYPRIDQQDCIDEFPWTGGLLPEIHNYGHVAVSGMCRERSLASVGRQPHDPSTSTKHQGANAPRSPEETPVASFLVTQFNTHKVVRTTLARDGSTFKAVTHEDLIVWDNPDVHPTDVLEDADGSILVIDTGGWFRIGCPASQLAKPEIPGAIYRIRGPQPKSRPTPPSSGRVTAEQLQEAEQRVGEFGPIVLRLTSESPFEHLTASQQLAHQFDHSDFRDIETSMQQLLAVTLIMKTIQRDTPDSHLLHSLIYALIRTNDLQATKSFLQDDSAAVRRAALIALDQMEGGDLTEADVIPLLETDDPALLQAVLTVISRHEGWVAETVPLFREWLTAAGTTKERLGGMRTFFLAQTDDLWVQELVGDAIAQESTQSEIRQMLIGVIADADVDRLPPLWADGLRVPLGLASDPDSRLAAMRTIGARSLAAHDGWLAEIALNDEEAPLTRIEAFAAMAARMESVPAELFGFAIQRLAGEGDLIEKLTLARGLSEAALAERQLLALAKAFNSTGPAVVPVLLPAFEKSGQETVGAALVEGLTTLGDALSLSPQELERLLERYPAAVQQQAGPLITRLSIDREAQAARLEELLHLTAEGGDPSRGRALFFGKMAGCSVCHQVGNEGGQVGPALTNIGAIRQPRDLLEAITFPSASFAREFRPYVVLTDEGRVHTGVISSRTSDSVTLRTADLKQVRIPRKSIDVMRESDTSIMPKGLDAKLSAGELTDLLAYLRSLR